VDTVLGGGMVQGTAMADEVTPDRAPGTEATVAQRTPEQAEQEALQAKQEADREAARKQEALRDAQARQQAQATRDQERQAAAQAQSDVDQAQQKVTDYRNATANLANADQALTAAQTALDKAKADTQTAQTAYDQAKRKADQADNDYHTAKTMLDQANAIKAARQTRTVRTTRAQADTTGHDDGTMTLAYDTNGDPLAVTGSDTIAAATIAATLVLSALGIKTRPNQKKEGIPITMNPHTEGTGEHLDPTDGVTDALTAAPAKRDPHHGHQTTRPHGKRKTENRTLLITVRTRFFACFSKKALFFGETATLTQKGFGVFPKGVWGGDTLVLAFDGHRRMLATCSRMPLRIVFCLMPFAHARTSGMQPQGYTGVGGR
jgi:chemotaxis protein histidine kinase CheA